MFTTAGLIPDHHVIVTDRRGGLEKVGDVRGTRSPRNRMIPPSVHPSIK